MTPLSRSGRNLDSYNRKESIRLAMKTIAIANQPRVWIHEMIAGRNSVGRRKVFRRGEKVMAMLEAREKHPI
jgi:hypothetical protein